MLIDPVRDFIQRIPIVKDDNTDPDYYWAAAGNTLYINTVPYRTAVSDMLDPHSVNSRSDGVWYYTYDRTRTSSEFPRYEGVAWGTYSCELIDWDKNGKCTQYSTFEQAQEAVEEFTWDPVLTHELGHLVGFDHPADSTKTTYAMTDSGCSGGELYYTDGPLMMQYERANDDMMLDGTLKTSVQYRLAKDAIAAGANYLKHMNPQHPVVHRSILMSVSDQGGKSAGDAAPVPDIDQAVGYTDENSSVKGASYCGGFNTTDYQEWTPASQMPSATVNAPKGYEASLNGTSWSSSVSVPAAALPSTGKLTVDAGKDGWTWKKDGKKVENFGLQDLPAVEVLFRRVKETKPSKPSNPSEPSKPGNPAGPSKPAKPSSGSSATRSSVRKPSDIHVVASKQPAKRMPKTGADVALVATLSVLLIALGRGLALRRQHGAHAE